jgi:hypothetical protein
VGMAFGIFLNFEKVSIEIIEDQIAKMIYKQIKNNKEKNNEQKNFSAKLKSTNTVETQDAAKDSMAKMKEILKY